MTQTPKRPNDRLEVTLGQFADLTIRNTQQLYETTAAQKDTIDVLVSNISQVTENVNRTNNNVNELTIPTSLGKHKNPCRDGFMTTFVLKIVKPSEDKYSEGFTI